MQENGLRLVADAGGTTILLYFEFAGKLSV